MCNNLKPEWDPERSSYGIFVEGEGGWVCGGVEGPRDELVQLGLVGEGWSLGAAVLGTRVHTLGPLRRLGVEQNPGLCHPDYYVIHVKC